MFIRATPVETRERPLPTKIAALAHEEGVKVGAGLAVGENASLRTETSGGSAAESPSRK
jgi:hypothetical protein